MLKRPTVLISLLLAASASALASDGSWIRYSFDLSGRNFFVSAPKGHFRDTYMPSIDLSKNDKSFVTLLKSSWVFSGLLADAGGLELIIGLSRAELGNTEEEFLRGIQIDLSKAYKKLRPQGVEIQNVTRIRMGKREWLCYSISNISAECALRVDPRHYISWKLYNVNNATSKIPARDELRKKIEDSIEIAF